MKANIRYEIEAARARARGQQVPPPPPMPRKPVAPTQPPSAHPLLISDPFAKQCLLEINEGKVLTFKEIAAKLRLHKDTVRRMFMKETGVRKFGTEYRVPQCVFDRVVLRSNP
jgi:transcriptional regulator GlxA family with amidase domain